MEIILSEKTIATFNHAYNPKNKNMSKILMLEKYKGEIEGEHTSVYIATDVNMNRFMSFNLALNRVVTRYLMISITQNEYTASGAI